MATRKDQLQSHQFSVQRMVSALVTRETDPETPPFKRVGLSAIWSVGVLVLALAVVWVYGMIVPGGNKAWSKGDGVIVEKETGTRYVYLDQHLHPVTNYVSALLAIGKKGDTRRVSQKSLAGVPRGPRIGIEDAPDALPAAKKLLTGGWTLCSQPTIDLAGARSSESVLMIGQQPGGGQALADSVMLVEVIGTGDRYLLRNGYRHRIVKADAVSVGLALNSKPWARVGSAFVDALPDGEPLAPIKIAAMGKPSSAVPGRKGTAIGQLFVVRSSGGGVQHYLATKNRLLAISALQFDIQAEFPATVAAYRGKRPKPIELSPAEAATADDPAPTVEEGMAPRSRPAFIAPRDGLGTICATFAPGTTPPAITVDAPLPPRDPMTVTPKIGRRGTGLADRILITPGTAAVVRAAQSDRAPSGAISVITDTARAYPLITPDLLPTLGYENIHPTPIPAALLARVPQGPGLSPQAALKPTP
ncbi:type VII secretion protein EccB [Kribbella sandramycini]|uniref:Type VII secretion protein EccB n=1 Tax=Kribbella sandramycini TaxID=60450 RepID=A0A7Y4L2F5_9ACTN|nr:type VII secretion protein EccB [Kribbella sandramycini]MBB6566256.1 type VII secretion protein EccB [Kribbella sandramycini]NOL43079.1 type VII secretion protein EccB [Kribbella sandramycini]